MADFTVNVAFVTIIEGTPISAKSGRSILGSTIITRGQPLWADNNDNRRVKLAQTVANDGDASIVVGVALSDVVDLDEDILYAPIGSTVNLGILLTAGAGIILSNTEGRLAPIADAGSSRFLSLIGFARDAARVKLILDNTGVRQA